VQTACLVLCAFGLGFALLARLGFRY